MPTVEEMNLNEIESAMVKLRERRRQLKRTGKAAERKVQTLTRRRERLLERVAQIEEQITALRREAVVVTEPENAPRRRGRKPKNLTIAE